MDLYEPATVILAIVLAAAGAFQAWIVVMQTGAVFIAVRAGRKKGMRLKSAPEARHWSKYAKLKAHAQWAEQNGFEFAGGYTFRVPILSRAFMGCWKRREEPIYFVAVLVGGTKFHYFATDFSDEFGLDTSSSVDDFLPSPPGTYKQSYRKLSLADLYARHMESADYLRRVGGIESRPRDLGIEEAISRDTQRRMAYIQTLPFWPFRFVYWYYIGKWLNRNRTIETLHRAGKVILPNEPAYRPFEFPCSRAVRFKMRVHTAVSFAIMAGATGGLVFSIWFAANGYRYSRSGPPLLGAIANGDVAYVAASLLMGADPNLWDSIETPLLRAASRDNSGNMVELLLMSGADPNDPGHLFGLPLVRAVREGSFETVRSLLDGGADPNLYDDSFRSPMTEAVASDSREIVNLLLKRGADPNGSGGACTSPMSVAAKRKDAPLAAHLEDRGAEYRLIHAIFLNDHDRFREMLQRDPAAFSTPEPVFNPSILSGDPPWELRARDLGVLIRATGPHTQSDYDALVNAGACITPLAVACHWGSREMVQELLDAGADPNADCFAMPLLLAVLKKDVELARLLLEHGADPDGNASLCRTPIQAAVMHAPNEMVELLLESGAGADGSAEHGECPLLVAVANDSLDLARTLLNAGADPDGYEGIEQTPLGVAAINLSPAMVELLIDQGADLNRYDASFKSPLAVAVTWEAWEIAEFLLAHGADPNGSGGLYTSPMSIAARLQRVDQVERLRDAGARFNPIHAMMLGDAVRLQEVLQSDPGSASTPLPVFSESVLRQMTKSQGHDTELETGIDGDALVAAGACVTPLSFACASESIEWVQALLKAGADPNTLTFAPPLTKAVSLGNLEIARLLLESGADPNPLVGPAPVTLACKSERGEMATLLRQYGATWTAAHAIALNEIESVRGLLDADPETANDLSISSINGIGNRLLHAAVDAEDEDLVSILLEHGADPNLGNDYGVTALHKAAQLGNTRLIETLIEAGADVTATTNAGRSALDLARSWWSAIVLRSYGAPRSNAAPPPRPTNFEIGNGPPLSETAVWESVRAFYAEALGKNLVDVSRDDEGSWHVSYQAHEFEPRLKWKSLSVNKYTGIPTYYSDSDVESDHVRPKYRREAIANLATEWGAYEWTPDDENVSQDEAFLIARPILHHFGLPLEPEEYRIRGNLADGGPGYWSIRKPRMFEGVHLFYDSEIWISISRSSGRIKDVQFHPIKEPPYGIFHGGLRREDAIAISLREMNQWKERWFLGKNSAPARREFTLLEDDFYHVQQVLIFPKTIRRRDSAGPWIETSDPTRIRHYWMIPFRAVDPTRPNRGVVKGFTPGNRLMFVDKETGQVRLD